ncbi:MAG: imidazole glycerol phosphate synthase subunit HisH [Paracoccaceae bacterium]
MTTALIDAGLGNLHSAAKAFARMSSGPVALVTTAAEVARADRIVLPGDGAFPAFMAALRAIPDMVETVTERAGAGTPTLGICVGMQVLAERGEEHGGADGLGLVPGRVGPLDAPGLTVPHMGWNDLTLHGAGHPLLAGVATGDHAYFVHSHAMTAADPGDVLATARHGGPVTAVIARGCVAGTQFHPEKSQATGLRIIANFLTWRP